MLKGVVISLVALSAFADDNVELVQTKPTKPHHHHHKPTKLSRGNHSKQATYVMGDARSTCEADRFISSKDACEEAAESLGITLVDCGGGGQHCMGSDYGTTSAEWTDGSAGSSEVDMNYIPKGCVLVPVSTDTSQRRRQLRYNAGDNVNPDKVNDYASPLCYASDSDDSESDRSGSVCRLDEDDTTTHGGDSTCRNCPKEDSIAACEQSCRDAGDCTGYEFRSSDGRCEIWTKPIKYKKPAASKWSCVRIRS